MSNEALIDKKLTKNQSSDESPLSEPTRYVLAVGEDDV